MCDFSRLTPTTPSHHVQSPSPIPPPHTLGSHFEEPLALNSIHLELLHNFITLTSHTLSNDLVLRNIWRITVPQIGFQYDYVMRSILALSALHMSLYSTDKRDFYLQIARSEHGAALQKIAATLPHVGADNCSALYISAALTFFYAWAAPRSPGDFFLVSNEGVAEWVFLLHGVRSISSGWHAELAKGPFSAMIRMGTSRLNAGAEDGPASTAWLSTTEHAHLTQLRRVISQAPVDRETMSILEKNIDNLEVSFRATFSESGWAAASDGSPGSRPDRNITAWALTSNIYSWLYKMDHQFIEMLNQRSPLALVVFAHFVVLLKYLGSCWWMQGWSTHLLQEIWSLLDEEHRMWIRWPIEEIGWLPSN